MLKLIQWQWDGYHDFHRSRKNLLIHIFAVPLLLIANISLGWALIQSAWVQAAVSAGIMLLSLVLQGKGHKIEETPSIPFSSPINAISRLFVEQWINFPRFVVSGAWWQAFRSSK